MPELALIGLCLLATLLMLTPLISSSSGTERLCAERLHIQRKHALRGDTGLKRKSWHVPSSPEGILQRGHAVVGH